MQKVVGVGGGGGRGGRLKYFAPTINVYVLMMVNDVHSRFTEGRGGKRLCLLFVINGPDFSADV